MTLVGRVLFVVHHAREIVGQTDAAGAVASGPVVVELGIGTKVRVVYDPDDPQSGARAIRALA